MGKHYIPVGDFYRFHIARPRPLLSYYWCLTCLQSARATMDLAPSFVFGAGCIRWQSHNRAPITSPTGQWSLPYISGRIKASETLSVRRSDPRK